MPIIVRNNGGIIDNAAIDVDFNTGFAIGIIAPGVVSLSVANIITLLIADAAITQIKLAADAVETDTIVDSSVTTPKMADDSINSSKVVNGTITDVSIGALQITPAKLAEAYKTDNLNPAITNRTAVKNVGSGVFDVATVNCAANEIVTSCGSQFAIPVFASQTEHYWADVLGNGCRSGLYCQIGTCTITTFATCLAVPLN